LPAALPARITTTLAACGSRAASNVPSGTTVRPAADLGSRPAMSIAPYDPGSGADIRTASLSGSSTQSSSNGAASEPSAEAG
jgi:hypothetical protein